MNDSEVISLSSDEEDEGPPLKKPKLQSVKNLKEITAKPCGDNKTRIPLFKEETNVTFIIDSNKLLNNSKKEEKETVTTIQICEEDVLNLSDGADECVIIEPKTKDESLHDGTKCKIKADDDDNECVIIEPKINGESLLDDTKYKTKANDDNECLIVEPKADDESLIDELELKIKEKDPLDSEISSDDQSVKDDSDTTEDQSEFTETVSNSTSEQNGFKEEIVAQPSTSKNSEAHTFLEKFLEVCTESLKDSKYADRIFPKFPQMRKKFNECEQIYSNPNFGRTVEGFTETAKVSAAEAVVSFQRLYSYLLDHIKGGSIEVSEENIAKIKKIEKTMKKLMKVIKTLEEAELNFDDEEDSTYMKLDRYSNRLNKVYNKYCQLLKTNPYAGRLSYEKIRFVHSNYDEINRAITKSYKHNKFPTYYDIEKCIRKCVIDNKLNLAEHEIKEESKHCFTKMGNLLQLRRKKELYEVHCGFISVNEDPANNDEELKKKLQENRVKGDQKLKDVVEKYVKMQESNVSVQSSDSDSDDSNYKSSGSED